MSGCCLSGFNGVINIIKCNWFIFEMPKVVVNGFKKIVHNVNLNIKQS